MERVMVITLYRLVFGSYLVHIFTKLQDKITVVFCPFLQSVRLNTEIVPSKG